MALLEFLFYFLYLCFPASSFSPMLFFRNSPSLFFILCTCFIFPFHFVFISFHSYFFLFPLLFFTTRIQREICKFLNIFFSSFSSSAFIFEFIPFNFCLIFHLPLPLSSQLCFILSSPFHFYLFSLFFPSSSSCSRSFRHPFYFFPFFPFTIILNLPLPYFRFLIPPLPLSSFCYHSPCFFFFFLYSIIGFPFFLSSLFSSPSPSPCFLSSTFYFLFHFFLLPALVSFPGKLQTVMITKQGHET